MTNTILRLGLLPVVRVWSEAGASTREIAERLRAEGKADVTHHAVARALRLAETSLAVVTGGEAAEDSAVAPRALRKVRQRRRPAARPVEAPPPSVTRLPGYDGSAKADRETVDTLIARYREVVFHGAERIRLPRWAVQYLVNGAARDERSTPPRPVDPTILIDERRLYDGDPDEEIEILQLWTPAARTQAAGRIEGLLKTKWGTRVIVEPPRGEEQGDVTSASALSEPLDPDVARNLERIRGLPNAAKIYMLAGMLPPNGVGESSEDVREALADIARPIADAEPR